MPASITRDEREALAQRLLDHADSITNVAAHDLEMDLRQAAAELQTIGEPLTLRATLPALRFELDRIAAACPDERTATQLRVIMGEARR